MINIPYTLFRINNAASLMFDGNGNDISELGSKKFLFLTWNIIKCTALNVCLTCIY